MSEIKVSIDTYITMALETITKGQNDDGSWYGFIEAFPGVYVIETEEEAVWASLYSVAQDWVEFRISKGRSLPVLHLELDQDA